ncbi:hypothetical protein F0562_010267 [Nyssa sinensis]|uniref:Uncharacterized protein n=1 Tax=Nyssa sinensis TaxID=561372 RepID=A0A5J5A120_9ASTE|nr:hypothetical protein F0562_010267 [Nyssa sinensis]
MEKSKSCVNWVAGHSSVITYRRAMKILSNNCILIILLIFVCGATQIHAQRQHVTCRNRRSPCFLKPLICPDECPTRTSKHPKAKVCYVNCDSPICKADCKHRKPNCDGNGAACFDPRFIGGDGIVFYFHGKRNEHFSLFSDHNLHINARFIGLRPAGRTRDFTWIQALGILFGSHTFSLEATKAATWDDKIDHLSFSYDGEEVMLPEGPLSTWKSPETKMKIERISSKNSVVVSLPDVVEIAVNVVPITKEDDRIHNYQIASDDCFAHLEVQFRFFGLSPEVEGVLGRTYQPDFENPAKPGVAMPVVGGEDKYRTTSLLSAGCKACMFTPNNVTAKESSAIMEYGMLDCTGGFSRGNGIVCKK